MGLGVLRREEVGRVETLLLGIAPSTHLSILVQSPFLACSYLCLHLSLHPFSQCYSSLAQLHQLPGEGFQAFPPCGQVGTPQFLALGSAPSQHCHTGPPPRSPREPSADCQSPSMSTSSSWFPLRMDSPSKYLLSAYCKLGSVLGTGDAAENKRQSPCPHEAYILHIHLQGLEPQTQTLLEGCMPPPVLIILGKLITISI